MPVPTSPQDLINIIREKLFNNTSGLIEEPDLREVLENIVKVLDAKFSFFSPTLTEEQYAQWNLILDFMLRETKGVLTTSSSAPTGNAAIGKYLLSGAGTYTHLGGLLEVCFLGYQQKLQQLVYVLDSISFCYFLCIDKPNNTHKHF